MPRDFPPEIQRELGHHLPSDYEMFWIRGVLFDWKEIHIEVGKSRTNRLFTSARIADVDSPPDNEVRIYEVLMTGADREYKFDPDDAVSIFGHRLKGSSEVVPRYMVNHNTGICNIIYKDLMVDDSGHFFTPASDMKVRNNWFNVKITVPGVVAAWTYGFFLFLFLCFIFFIGGLFLVVAIVSFIDPKAGITDNSAPFVFTASIIYGVLALILCYSIAKSAASKKNYKTTFTRDLMPSYRQATDLLYDVIREHQVPERRFLIKRREI